MFKWSQEYSKEVNSPIEKMWDFLLALNHWTLWLDEFESFQSKGEFKKGCVVIGKPKKYNFEIPITITEINPFQECSTLVKSPFLFSQKASYLLHKISDNKTRATLKMSAKGILTPFFSSSFHKKSSIQFEKCWAAFLKKEECNAYETNV